MYQEGSLVDEDAQYTSVNFYFKEEAICIFNENNSGLRFLYFIFTINVNIFACLYSSVVERCTCNAKVYSSTLYGGTTFGATK